jgi:cytochrome c peroxidase
MRLQSGQVWQRVLVAGCIVWAAVQAATPAEIAAMKEKYRRAPAPAAENPVLVDLGRLLFWDPRVSESGKTACVNCHLPYLGWATTDARSRDDSGSMTARKSPPLIGIGHIKTSAFGWDGRAPTLEAQILNAIGSGAMAVRPGAANLEAIEERVRAVPDYAAAFGKALPNEPISMQSIAIAIAAFERTLQPGIAPFDRWVEGDEDAISESAKRGFALFDTACAACHSGWRFTDDSFHDSGISSTDLGRGREIKEVQVVQYAFKTPTLRSVALRPPYMHDASSANLYEAVRHYETGGIDRPSRSPRMAPLKLSEKDRLDLVAFMQTLTGMPEGEAAPKLPASPK